MNRNFNIVLPNSNQLDKNLINIDIGNLSTIINYSADLIRCSCLEYLDDTIINSVFNEILSKIKPKGQLIISIRDLKQYSSDFINGVISGQELLHHIKPAQTILSIDDIYTKIDHQTIKVIQVIKDKDQKTITVVLERISV